MDNYIVSTKVREEGEELLSLVYRTWVVGDDHGLPHPFDTQVLAERLLRIKLAAKFLEAIVTSGRKSLCNNLKI